MLGANSLNSKAFNWKNCVTIHICNTGYKWWVANGSKCSLFHLWLCSMTFKCPAQAHSQTTWPLAFTTVMPHTPHKSSFSAILSNYLQVYCMSFNAVELFPEGRLKPRSPWKEDVVLIRKIVPLAWCPASAVVTIFY